MVLEWLRRHDPALDGHLRNYLFKEGSVSARAEALEEKGGESENAGSLGIGSLRGEAQTR